MAVERPIVVPIRREERTDQVLIDCPPGQTYVVTLSRVTRDIFPDGSTSEVSRREVRRDLTALMADADAAPLLALLPPIFDRWAQEDDGA